MPSPNKNNQLWHFQKYAQVNSISRGPEGIVDSRHPQNDLSKAKKENIFSVEPSKHHLLAKEDKGISPCKTEWKRRIWWVCKTIPTTLYFLQTLQACSLITEETCIDPDGTGGLILLFPRQKKAHTEIHTALLSPVRNTGWATSNMPLGSDAWEMRFSSLEIGRIFP